MTKKAEYVVRNALRDWRSRANQMVRNCLRRLRKEGITPTQPGVNDYLAATETVEMYLRTELHDLVAEWEQKRSNYEPLFSMPPARRKTAAPAKPLTLVERRAVAAKAKVVQWQRKQKLAATKVRQYRKKVSYYTKKGVIR